MVSDGTKAGTGLVADINPGPGSSYVLQPTAGVNGLFLFWADDGVHGRELWRSDGTAAGTYLLQDINLPVADAKPWALADLNGKLLFAANDGTTERAPWVSDGTAMGTVSLGTLSSNDPPTRVLWYAVTEDTGYFTATTNQHGTELWKTDGTAAGTSLVKDIRTDGDSGISNLATAGGLLFFSASDGTTKLSQLWRSDGTTNGTFPLGEMWVTQIIGRGAYAYVSVEVKTFTTSSLELWRSDGTAKGTIRLLSISTDAFRFDGFVTVGQYLYVVSRPGEGVEELWRTDGTPNGSVQLKSIDKGRNYGAFNVMVPFRGALYFGAWNSTSEQFELWKTDGTTIGTFKVHDVAPSFATVAGDTMYITGFTPSLGLELWKTDGTTEGTVLVKDIYAGPGGSNPVARVTPDGSLFVEADDGVHGREPWKTDGTAAGTVMIKDIWPGDRSSIPFGYSGMKPMGSGGLIVFYANDGKNGTELWSSDGTAAGTRMVQDIFPSDGSSSPSDLCRVGSRLFFAASEPAQGRELWSVALTDLGGVLAAPFGRGCAGTGGLVPRISTTGLPTIGNAAFAIDLDTARPSSNAVLGVDIQRGLLRLDSCMLYLANVLAALPGRTDSNGHLAMRFALPASNALIGTQAFVQFMVQDPNGAWSAGASFSEGMHLLVNK